jgi:hypothetical protein
MFVETGTLQRTYQITLHILPEEGSSTSFTEVMFLLQMQKLIIYNILKIIIS